MTADRMKQVEEKVHTWYLKNQNKTFAGRDHWWNIKDDFLQYALKEIGISLEDYQDFFQKKSEEYSLVATSE